MQFKFDENCDPRWQAPLIRAGHAVSTVFDEGLQGPIVRVFHPEAKVTHEAAIGSVDKKELETLMARGLTPEQAVEMIVSGILR